MSSALVSRVHLEPDVMEELSPVGPVSARGGNKVTIDRPLLDHANQLGLGDVNPNYGVPTGSPQSILHSVAKYDNPYTRFEPEAGAMQKAQQYLQLLLQPFMRNLKPYSYDETIRSMDGSKAAGYPYNALPSDHPHFGKKKVDFLSDEPVIHELVDPALRELYPEFTGRAYTGWFDNRYNIWNSSHKHEILPVKKLKNQAPGSDFYVEGSRAITYPSFPLAFLEAMFLGPLEACYRAASLCSEAVGSRIGHSGFYGGILDVISNRPKGWSIQTSDLSAYDSTQNSALMAAEVEVVTSLIHDDNPAYAATLQWLNHVGTNSNMVQSNGQVLRKFNGMNSGARNTSGGNTRRRFLMNVYCFFKLFPAATFTDFSRNVKMYMMGDDDLLYVHPDYAEVYSSQARGAILWEDFGIILKTDEPDSFTFTGHTFIGYDFRETAGGTLPCVKTEKTMAGVGIALEKESPEQAYVRLASLAVQTHFCVTPDGSIDRGEAAYQLIKNAALNAIGFNTAPTPFPSRSDIEWLWLGHERTKRKPPSREVMLFFSTLSEVSAGEGGGSSSYDEKSPSRQSIIGGIRPQGLVRPTRRATRRETRSFGPNGWVWAQVLLAVFLLLAIMAAASPSDVIPISSAGGYAGERASTNDVPAMDRAMREKLPGLTKKGRDWMKAALDPFHDTVETVEGYPDPKGGYSIQLCKKSTRTISAPPGLLPGETWDCHVLTTGLLLDQDITSTTVSSDGSVIPFPTLTPSSPPIGRSPKMGTVTIVTGKSGSSTTPSFTSPPSLDTLQVQAISPIDVAPGGIAIDGFLDGRARLNYGGVEIVNVTPALYRGGACLVYNQMGAPNLMSYNIRKNGQTTPVWVQTAAPPTEAKAVLLQGARQWGAEKGAYFVFEFADMDLPACQPSPGLFCLMGGDFAPGAQGPTVVPYNYGWLTSPTEVPFVKIAPLNGKGAYFTGLSAETVLKVNVRFGIEMFPTEKDEIAMLASSMSPVYDPAALTAYQQVLFSMPPGVQLDENFTGEWFKKALGAIGKAAPTILRGVAAVAPDPRIKLLAGAGASLIDRFNGSSAGEPAPKSTKAKRAEERGLIEGYAIARGAGPAKNNRKKFKARMGRL